MTNGSGDKEKWRRKSFVEIVTELTSGPRNWSQYYADDGDLFLRMTNLSRDGIALKLNDVKYVQVPQGASESQRTQVAPGDILFSVTAELGKLAWIPDYVGKAYINQHTALIRVNSNKADSKFLAYLLSSHREQTKIKRLNDSGAKAGISLKTLRAYSVRMPLLPEQQKIAAILSTWDRAIELTEKLIAAKQRRKQALIQQLLTGKVRFKEFEGSPWKWVELGALTKQVKRPIQWDENQLYKLASIRRHSKGMFFREPAYGHQIKVKKLFTVERNDFLISNIQAAYGAMGLVPKKFDNTYISDQYTVLVARDENKLDIHFLGFVSETAWFRNQILLACNGFLAERLRLLFSADELLKRKLFVPPSTKEQRRIVEVLRTAVRELRSAEKKLEHLKGQKRGLMQQLLTGKVRVNMGSVKG